MMDTPKRAVSWLESFPPDIWSYFTYYLPGEQLGRLMMTGATSLWRRLSSPKVVKSIKLGADFMVFKSFPRFFNGFPSLMELLIDSRCTDWGNKLDLKLDSMPSSLRKLELSGFWTSCDHLADQLFGENITSLKLDEHLPHLEILQLPRLQFANYTWMIHSPPSLTTLAIHRWDGTVELPASLIHFEAETVRLNEFNFVSKLPSLESFVVGLKLDGIGLVVPILPPSCRKVCLGPETVHCGGIKSLQKLFEQLPKFLTSFSACGLNFREDSELASFLPPRLTVLDMFPGFPSAEWLTFPRSLTKLSFRGTGRDRFLCDPPETSDQAFPPQLTYLSIPSGQLSLKAAKLLPPSLTHLTIGNLCAQVCEHIPIGLKTLTSYRTLISPSLIKFLPKSLTNLQLIIYEGFGDWYDCNTCERINEISTLPEYSIHKLSGSNSFAWQFYSPLPFSLQVLDICNNEGIGDSFLLQQRLSNLMVLNLPTSKCVTNNSIPLLSPHLTTLNLQWSSCVSGKSFEFLPRNLTHLNLRSSESIFDSDIPHLPRTLKQAFLDQAIHLTDSSIADLPPHMERLSVKYNSKITPSSFPHFPYSLRSSSSSKSVHFSLWGISWGEIYP